MKFSVSQRTLGRRMVTKSMHRRRYVWGVEDPMPEKLRRVRNMELLRGKTAVWWHTPHWLFPMQFLSPHTSTLLQPVSSAWATVLHTGVGFLISVRAIIPDRNIHTALFLALPVVFILRTAAFRNFLPREQESKMCCFCSCGLRVLTSIHAFWKMR